MEMVEDIRRSIELLKKQDITIYNFNQFFNEFQGTKNMIQTSLSKDLVRLKELREKLDQQIEVFKKKGVVFEPYVENFINNQQVVIEILEDIKEYDVLRFVMARILLEKGAVLIDVAKGSTASKELMEKIEKITTDMFKYMKEERAQDYKNMLNLFNPYLDRLVKQGEIKEDLLKMVAVQMGEDIKTIKKWLGVEETKRKKKMEAEEPEEATGTVEEEIEKDKRSEKPAKKVKIDEDETAVDETED